MKNKYYSLAKIDKYDCAYKLIIGKRSNGKTYAVLNKGLKIFLETGVKMAYVRRYRDDITAPNLMTLFDPQPIAEMSGGLYTGVSYRSRQFCLLTEDGEKSEPFCETFALNTWERSKGADRGQYSIIVFDEFITRDQYLKDETNIFLNILSSLLRDRAGTNIYMIANTVSQFCPYFADFNIDIANLKQGEIQQTRDNVAIEYCADNGATTADYFKGFKKSHTDMITAGKWEIRDYPHLQKSHKDYNFHLRFFVCLTDRVLAGELLSGDSALFLYFYPFTGIIRNPEKTIIYSRIVSANPIHCCTFKSRPTAAHEIIAMLIDQNKIYYSDNMTGEALTAFIKGGF